MIKLLIDSTTLHLKKNGNKPSAQALNPKHSGSWGKRIMDSRHVGAEEWVQGQPEQLSQTLFLKIIERWDHCVVVRCLPSMGKVLDSVLYLVLSKGMYFLMALSYHTMCWHHLWCPRSTCSELQEEGKKISCCHYHFLCFADTCYRGRSVKLFLLYFLGFLSLERNSNTVISLTSSSIHPGENGWG